MVFNCLAFVVFFALVLGLHSLPLPWTTKKINLLIASYIFYAAWNPPFVILLWISTVVDWYAARGLVEAKRQSARHAFIVIDGGEADDCFWRLPMHVVHLQRLEEGNQRCLVFRGQPQAKLVSRNGAPGYVAANEAGGPEVLTQTSGIEPFFE